MIELAGGIIGAGMSGAYPRLSMETVLEKDPEILVFQRGQPKVFLSMNSKHGSGGPVCRLSNVIGCMSRLLDALNRPGPRVVDGLEQLAQVIHPEAFSSDHPPSSRP